MRLDERVITLGEDIGVNGGVFRATTGLQEEFGEDRCFDTPLAESGIVGSAFGMAVAGLRPVVEIQFSGFIWTSFNQIINHVSRIRTRTQGAFTAPLVIRMPYGGGVRALEHHSESMEAILAHVPGIKVVIPSTPHDAKGLLIASIRDPDPVIFMEPKRVYRTPKQEIPDGDFVIPLGTARVVLPGEDLTIVSYGAQMKEVMASARQLRGEVSVEVVDLRTIYPPDLASVLSSVRKTGRLMVVHEGPRSFGVGAELTASVVEQAFLYLEAPPVRLTGSDIIVPLPRHESHYLISVADITGAAQRLMQY
jgi:pyruvate dehydrogenase E1 component beta subunit